MLSRLTALLLVMVVSGCAFAPEERKTSIPPPGGGDWLIQPSLGTGVVLSRASVVDDKLCVVGGFTSLGGPSARVQVFDGETWSVSDLKLKTARAGHAQALLDDGRLLVAGGQSGSAVRPRGLDSVEILDLRLGRVISGATLPEPMLTPTAHRLIDGRVAVIGHETMAILDPTGERVTRVISLRERRRDHASVVLGDEVVVLGGYVDSVEVINTTTGISRLLSVRLPMRLDDHRAVAMADGRVWVLGGQSTKTGDTTPETWFIDTQLSRITEGPVLNVEDGIADACLLRAGERAWLLGGESQVSGRDTELAAAHGLDLVRGVIHPMPDMPTVHDDASAALWLDQVWVAGGVDYLEIMGRRVPRAHDRVSSTTIVE
ncbi:Kelch repeat-containing protein [Mucisphaera calidilacus]|uniref:Kelch motif protein n=1 Tax=Mucisphaera calidilacus TaxID=2527982 RepID=A0A518BW14_9BACT|nr:hypothetical protein [Mucisphaera calidilacus]QDU71170.1 Kelch motif protein [Mucisphaera calidilacus]